MVKSQLVLRIYVRDAGKIVEAIFDQMALAMVRRERVELRDFGMFGVKVWPARTGRNPKNKAAGHVPEKIMPTFRSGKGIRMRLNPGPLDG